MLGQGSPANSEPPCRCSPPTSQVPLAAANGVLDRPDQGVPWSRRPVSDSRPTARPDWFFTRWQLLFLLAFCSWHSVPAQILAAGGATQDTSSPTWSGVGDPQWNPADRRNPALAPNETERLGQDGSDPGLAKRPVRLRFTWGGGKENRWEGRFRLVGSGPNAWRDLQLLSIDPDAPGSVRLLPDSNSIQVSNRRPIGQFSFQVDCWAPIENTHLEIQFKSRDQLELVIYQLVDLKSLVDQPWSIRLGNNGNGLWIERPVEDQIRFARRPAQDLIPLGHAFEVMVHPNRLSLPRESTVRYHLKLTDLSGSAGTIWETRGDFQWNPATDPPELGPFPFIAGPAEGVYQLQAEFSLPRSALNPFSGQVLASRAVQWVVLPEPVRDSGFGPDDGQPGAMASPLAGEKSKPAATDPAGDGETLVIRPEQLAGSWQRSLDISRINWLPRIQSSARSSEEAVGSRGSEALRLVDVDGRSAWELGPGQWRWIELPPVAAGSYVIEVEHPARQELAISLQLIQPDRWGRIPHWTHGWGVNWRRDPLLPNLPQVATAAATSTEGWQRASGLVWFNAGAEGKSGWLVLRNATADRSVRVGTIRLQPLTISAPPAGTSAGAPAVQRRQVGLYLETPLLASAFSSRRNAASANSPPLNDWLAYHEATQRLAEYLQHKGYNTVWLPILSQGGSLFPSSPYQTSPRFENSSFGTLGQGSSRMDVVDLLLQRLEQRGLTMVPILDFSGLLDGPSGGGDEPHPLDENFQQLVLSMVGMVAQRYRGRASLAGLGIDLNFDGQLIFGSDGAGLDKVTAAKFMAATGIRWPDEQLGDWTQVGESEVSRWILRQHRPAWLRWRTEALTDFYSRIAAAAAGEIGEAGEASSATVVYFVANGWHRGSSLDASLYPTLRSRPQWREDWHRMGVDVSWFENPGRPRLIFQWPAAESPELSANRRVLGNWRGPEFWQAVQGLESLSLAVQRPVRGETLEGLNKLTVDHANQRPQSVVVDDPEGSLVQRWAEALRWRDVRGLSNQAWGLPRGLHVHERQFAQAFGQLPDVPFQTVFQDAASPVVIRQAEVQGQWWIYIVNAARWPVACQLRTVGTSAGRTGWTDRRTGTAWPPAGQAESVGGSRGGGMEWKFTLPASSLTVLRGPAMEVENLTTSDAQEPIFDDLRVAKESLFRRLRQASSNAQVLHGLKNPGFEAAGQPGTKAAEEVVEDWTFGVADPASIVVRDPKSVHSGDFSLRLVNEGGVVWLRSNPLAAPRTGRLSVTAWLRNHPQRPVSSVRLAVDGETNDGGKFYRFAEIPLAGANTAAPNSSPGQWQPVAVHFDDLPEQGISHLRIGLDLMEVGELGLDSVQCYENWLDANDQKILSNRLGLAAFALENKRNGFAAYQALDDYWIRFLQEYVPDPNRMAVGEPAEGGSELEPRGRSARGVRRLLPIR